MIMKREDKDLLLKDLCGRLPYGVMLNIEDICDKHDEILSIIESNINKIKALKLHHSK